MSTKKVSISTEAIITLLVAARSDLDRDPICYCKDGHTCFTCHLIVAAEEANSQLAAPIKVLNRPLEKSGAVKW